MFPRSTSYTLTSFPDSLPSFFFARSRKGWAVSLGVRLAIHFLERAYIATIGHKPMLLNLAGKICYIADTLKVKVPGGEFSTGLQLCSIHTVKKTTTMDTFRDDKLSERGKKSRT